jgi:hypothetical protein
VRDPATGQVKWTRDRRQLYAVAVADDLVYLASESSAVKSVTVEALRADDARRILHHEVYYFGREGEFAVWLRVTPAALVVSMRRGPRLEVITVSPAAPGA